MDCDNSKEDSKETKNQIRPPFLCFNWENSSAPHTSNILADFRRNINKTLESQEGVSLDHVSELKYLLYLITLFRHHDYRKRILDVIQKGYRYHLSPIKEATRKYDSEAAILMGHHKLGKTNT